MCTELTAWECTDYSEFNITDISYEIYVRFEDHTTLCVFELFNPCSECGSDNLKVQEYTDREGHIFYDITCKQCKNTTQLIDDFDKLSDEWI